MKLADTVTIISLLLIGLGSMYFKVPTCDNLLLVIVSGMIGYIGGAQSQKKE